MRRDTKRILLALLQLPAVVYVIAAVAVCSAGWSSAEGLFSLLLPPFGLIGLAAMVLSELWCCLTTRLTRKWRVTLVLLNSVGIVAAVVVVFCAADFYST